MPRYNYYEKIEGIKNLLDSIEKDVIDIEKDVINALAKLQNIHSTITMEMTRIRILKLELETILKILRRKKLWKQKKIK